jgi:5'-nucleotidase (lipoprotein e(P4) family)
MLAGLAALLPAFLSGAPPAAAAPPPANTANLDAVLWMQKAPEYGLVAAGQWRALADRLPALKRRGEALVPSDVPAERALRRPPAIIVDLDETVIDNSPANAETASGLTYDEARWQGWLGRVDEQFAVPGAVAALQAAARAGFRVFYVSNRECPAASAPPVAPHSDCPARRHTLAVLTRLGLPFADDPSALLLRNDQQGWGDKTARRQFLAKSFRIAALVGDDIGDFLPRTEAEQLIDSIGQGGTVAARMAAPDSLMTKMAAHAGRDWFVLPNPAYGSWERRQGSRIACSNPSLAGTACGEAALAAKQGRLVLPGGAQRLRLATWNMEWLMPAEVRDALLARCAEGQPPSAVRALPCPREPYPPVPRHDAADIALMAVPGYTPACFVNRAHPQKTGFVVRTGISFRCNGDLTALDDDGAARAGADITLWPDTPHAVRMLSVHLKSGCFGRPLSDRENPVCARLQTQVPILAGWVAARQAAGEAFAVLGDFNRRMEIDAALPAGESLWAALSAAAPVVRITQGQDYRPCRADEGYAAFIDNIVLGGALNGLRRDIVHVAMTDAPPEAILSDHCLLGADLWAWPGGRGGG